MREDRVRRAPAELGRGLHEPQRHDQPPGHGVVAGAVGAGEGAAEQVVEARRLPPRPGLAQQLAEEPGDGAPLGVAHPGAEAGGELGGEPAAPAGGHAGGEGEELVGVEGRHAPGSVSERPA